MIRRPPRSTLSSSSAASDVYKRQGFSRNGSGRSCRSERVIGPTTLQHSLLRHSPHEAGRDHIEYKITILSYHGAGGCAIGTFRMHRGSMYIRESFEGAIGHLSSLEEPGVKHVIEDCFVVRPFLVLSSSERPKSWVQRHCLTLIALYSGAASKCKPLEDKFVV